MTLTAVLAILCLAAGGAAMAVCDRRKARLLKEALAQTEENARRQALRFPYNEVLLGLLLTLAVLFCATKCLASGRGMLLEFGIGYLAALLTSYGSYQRLRKAIDELGLPHPPASVLRSLAGFCCGMALFLVGTLALTRRLFLYHT